MKKTVKAEIISIGTELLRGEITDTNAGYLASQLPLVGIELQRMTTADDDTKKLAQVLRNALKNSSIVITTGGLGPTQDDLTRESIALVMDEQLFIDAALEKHLRITFSQMGREMPPANLQQAMRIPCAQSLPNPRGTAPGWWVEKNDKVIVVMPGPPREMLPMWQNEALPRIKNRFPGEQIQARTIKTFSIQEAKVAELIHPFFGIANPTLGIYAKTDGIQVRLIAHGTDAAQLLDVNTHKIQQILSPYVWGTDTDTLGGIIGNTLSQSGMSLATMEDYTGGLLGNMITDSALSSQFYRGGLITGSDMVKIDWGIPAAIIEKKGTASCEVAEAMAAVVKDKFSSDFGLSVTGLSYKNSSGGQFEMVCIGVADAGGTKSWEQQFMWNRNDSFERAAVAALFRLRERLIDMNLLDYVK